MLTAAVESIVCHKVTLHGSSRTDSGVHARALPVNFETPRDIPLLGYLKGLNSKLPADLGIISVEERPLGWRTRFASVAKTYIYRFQLGPSRWPLLAVDAWRIKYPRLDVDAMNHAAEAFIGIHDFSAFRSVHCVSRTTQRKMYEVSVSRREDAPIVEMRVIGNAFLHNMVRVMAGTLLRAGLGKMTKTDVERALVSGRREDAGTTAAAEGLTLWQVHFDGYPRLGKPPMPGGLPDGAGNNDAGDTNSRD